ncbi:DnaA ATPase domain-containing protein [Jeotgalibacillus proteolyticus]|uniref:ATP-binding protein n=1 Tax=Jeotgalibacillus proteolyticus TaxID=2082395 RepID=A0A2S5GC81_9BACL|nr:ATP-binding protein [Jeotgalibacillus proteolyticus]
MQEVLTELRSKTRSQAVRSEGYEENKVKCSICRDKAVVIYRVHKDTEWEERKAQNGSFIEVPKEMVLEEDFLAGDVCSPDKAWEWRTTYSKRCTCIENSRLERILKASEITEEFKKLGFGNFRTEGKNPIIHEAKEAAHEYYTEFDHIRGNRQNSIALLGQPGSGKTHLLMAVSNNLMQKKKLPVLYFPYVEGFNDLKDDFTAIEKKLKRMKEVEVLFIDDLFKPVSKVVNGVRIKVPRATEWQIEQMYAVLNYRYLNHKPILVSSELTVDELADVDEALGTRIYQMCKDFTVLIQGDRKELNHRLED